ncbi:MAG: serine hydrolase domain-containing protein [Bacteroidota bacterium]
MKTLKFNLAILFFAFVVFSNTGCEEFSPNDTLCTDFAMNLDKLEENLVDELDSRTMGYAYVISRDGNHQRSGSDGNGRNNTDGQKDFSVNNRMQVASISKTITTVATLSLLEEKGVDVNSSVEPYLPPHWTRGPGIENLTFYDLIWQSAALNVVGTQGFNATRYDSLQAYVLAGAQGNKNVRRYSNTNHGMLRVILPRLWDVPRPNDGLYDEDFTTSVYKQCIQDVIFDKIGVNNADCLPPGNNPNLAYTGPADVSGGSGGSSDFSNVAGGIGWNLSTMHIANFFAHSMFANTFISDDAIDLMMNDEAGFWNSRDGDKGRYICKLGGWNYGGTPSSNFNSCIMQYPGGYQVTIFVNSNLTNGKSLGNVARDAYDDAWGCN